MKYYLAVFSSITFANKIRKIGKIPTPFSKGERTIKTSKKTINIGKNNAYLWSNIKE